MATARTGGWDRRGALRAMTAGALGLVLPTARDGVRAESAPLQRGVQLGLFHEDALWSYAGLLREIRELGTSHVGLTVAYYQEHAGSTEIYDHPRFTAPDSTIERTLREAHDLGLKAMVFPIVRLERSRSSSEWRGTLKPQDPGAWWRSYTRLLVRVARLCARAGAEQLSVGSELSTLDVAAERPAWQGLVGEVRQKFRGLLTYSGNWDHFERVGIYDLLDLAGLCAYFPLASWPAVGMPEVADLTAAWRKKRTELEAFAARVGRPMILTEVGYLSQRGCAHKPWDEGAKNPVDIEEQRRCYAAFADAWAGAPTLRGAYFWNYYGWGGPASIGYTPRGKPAAAEITRYFRNESTRPAR